MEECYGLPEKGRIVGFGYMNNPCPVLCCCFLVLPGQQFFVLPFVIQEIHCGGWGCIGREGLVFRALWALIRSLSNHGLEWCFWHLLSVP